MMQEEVGAEKTLFERIAVCDRQLSGSEISALTGRYWPIADR